MHIILKNWILINGPKFIEYKVRGGDIVMASNDMLRGNLTQKECLEFYKLHGQLEGLLKAFCPDYEEEVVVFLQEVKEALRAYEEAFAFLSKYKYIAHGEA
jgi:hypothetical protein